MRFNLLRPSEAVQGVERARVYASIDELARLQAEATGFSLLPRQPVHSLLAGRHASRLRGRGLSFDEIRQYRPGDDIRNMDWKVTARTRRPHVRVFTEERDRPSLLIVDQRQSMFFGTRRCMKSVAAAEAAALAAWRVLGVGDRVGAFVFDDAGVVEIRPHRSRARVMQILGTVVAMNRRLAADRSIERNPAALDAVLRRARRVATHDHTVVVITDGTGVSAQTVQEAALIAAHNDLIWVRIFDPFEAELPDVGRVILGEGAALLAVATSDRSLREAYRREFGAQMDWAHSTALKAEVPHLPVSTAEGVAIQIRRLIGETTGR
jgi:uncharacterized protein (DUF58 family)